MCYRYSHNPANEKELKQGGEPPTTQIMEPLETDRLKAEPHLMKPTWHMPGESNKLKVPSSINDKTNDTVLEESIKCAQDIVPICSEIILAPRKETKDTLFADASAWRSPANSPCTTHPYSKEEKINVELIMKCSKKGEKAKKEEHENNSRLRTMAGKNKDKAINTTRKTNNNNKNKRLLQIPRPLPPRPKSNEPLRNKRLNKSVASSQASRNSSKEHNIPKESNKMNNKNAVKPKFEKRPKRVCLRPTSEIEKVERLEDITRLACGMKDLFIKFDLSPSRLIEYSSHPLNFS